MREHSFTYKVDIITCARDSCGAPPGDAPTSPLMRAFVVAVADLAGALLHAAKIIDRATGVGQSTMSNV
jgi:hypothetical protein